MKIHGLTALVVVGLAVAACGKKDGQGGPAADASPAAVEAAAGANSVTSIPGYSPEGGADAPAGNAAP
jgi:hypothetical protein